MAKWHYQFPSVTLRRIRVGGDDQLAELYKGEADKLLYQLKNLMKFRQLGQLKMTRLYLDGTSITAQHIFGMDMLTINLSRRVDIDDINIGCSITLINFPTKIGPMKNPGEITVGEKEGIDYIKTYYTTDTSRCPKCEPEITFVFSFNFSTEEQIDYYDSEPDNHCVYSRDNACSGEIISTGNDDGGTYFIWKAYTESKDHDRSGLGYVKLTVSILNENTKIQVCATSEIVQVDCCEKPDLEPHVLYWAKEISNFIEADYEDEDVYRYGPINEEIDLVPVPQDYFIDKLLDYIYDNNGILKFYCLPEIGGCPQYDWILEGPGALEFATSDYAKTVATYIKPNERSCDNLSITITDRCGGEILSSGECCDHAEKPILGILYTSLLMGCGTTQTLTASGGCGPYSWSLNGSGILTVTGPKTAEYEAPATNPECNNPQISVTDCCGHNATIEIAVNANPDGIAYWVTTYDDAGSVGTCCAQPHRMCRLMVKKYNCDGSFNSQCVDFSWLLNTCGVNCSDIEIPLCRVYGCPWEPGWSDLCMTCGCQGPGEFCFMNPLPFSCYSSSTLNEAPKWVGLSKNCEDCAGLTDLDYAGHACDKRTAPMISDGCCPINPETGLPF